MFQREQSHPSFFNCGYNSNNQKSGFNRIKSYCPNVYNHLSAIQDNEKIWVMDHMEPRSMAVSKQKTTWWQRQSGVFKLVGSFLIGVLFLSLVAVAVFIRVETKTMNDSNDILLASSSSTSSSSSIINKHNRRQINSLHSTKTKLAALFMNKKQPSNIKNSTELFDESNVESSTSKTSKTLQESNDIVYGEKNQNQSSITFIDSFFPIRLIINEDQPIRHANEGENLKPSDNKTIASKRIIIEMDIKVNRSTN